MIKHRMSTNGCQSKSTFGAHELHLARLVINCVASLPQVVRLLDVREDAAADAHHPQELVDVITWIAASVN